MASATSSLDAKPLLARVLHPRSAYLSSRQSVLYAGAPAAGTRLCCHQVHGRAGSSGARHPAAGATALPRRAAAH
eukprot:6188801-Pleurochrysis_carterae.AAC.6